MPRGHSKHSKGGQKKRKEESKQATLGFFNQMPPTIRTDSQLVIDNGTVITPDMVARPSAPQPAAPMGPPPRPPRPPPPPPPPAAAMAMLSRPSAPARSPPKGPLPALPPVVLSLSESAPSSTSSTTETIWEDEDSTDDANIVTYFMNFNSKNQLQMTMITTNDLNDLEVSSDTSDMPETSASTPATTSAVPLKTSLSSAAATVAMTDAEEKRTKNKRKNENRKKNKAVVAAAEEMPASGPPPPSGRNVTLKHTVFAAQKGEPLEKIWNRTYEGLRGVGCPEARARELADEFVSGKAGQVMAFVIKTGMVHTASAGDSFPSSVYVFMLTGTAPSAIKQRLEDDAKSGHAMMQSGSVFAASLMGGDAGTRSMLSARIFTTVVKHEKFGARQPRDVKNALEAAKHKMFEREKAAVQAAFKAIDGGGGTGGTTKTSGPKDKDKGKGKAPAKDQDKAKAVAQAQGECPYHARQGVLEAPEYKQDRKMGGKRATADKIKAKAKRERAQVVAAIMARYGGHAMVAAVEEGEGEAETEEAVGEEENKNEDKPAAELLADAQLLNPSLPTTSSLTTLLTVLSQLSTRISHTYTFLTTLGGFSQEHTRLFILLASFVAQQERVQAEVKLLKVEKRWRREAVRMDTCGDGRSGRMGMRMRRGCAVPEGVLPPLEWLGREGQGGHGHTRAGEGDGHAGGGAN